MGNFAGEFLFSPGRANVELVGQMAAKLIAGAGDQEATLVSTDGRCAIGFRRSTPHDQTGRGEPGSSPDGQIMAALNGEAYNLQKLCGTLTGQGATFNSRSHAEAIIHLYSESSDDLAHQLQGAFCLVLYDASKGELLMIRDRLGQRPLWYAALPDRVVFGTEAKAVLGHSGVNKSLDMLSIQHVLSLGYIPAPHTIWSGIRKAVPATVMRWQNHTPLVTTYWVPEPVASADSRAERLERIRSGIVQSVETMMAGDVAVGALLSGGLDSSIVVAMMSRAAGRAGGVKTFTAGFAEEGFDERAAARIVAKRFHTEHKEVTVEPVPDRMLDQLVEIYGEPFADSSSLPTWLICQATGQHVSVAMVGDGGDEVFGGYDRYRAVHLAATMGPGAYMAVRLAGLLARPWAGPEERGRLRRVVRFAEALPLPPALQYFRYRSLFSPEELRRLLTEEFAQGRDLEATARWFCELYEEGELEDEVARAQRHDLLTYLPDDGVVKAERASAAAGLVLRAPMLDSSLVGLGLSLPAEMKVSWHRGKLALREAFQDVLPQEVLSRPKRGFAIPLGRWLRNELRQAMVDSLTDSDFLGRGIFRKESVIGLINDHLGGRDDHGHRLWALMILARWLRKQGEF